MKNIQLSVKGMKCGGCVSTVENILKNSEGVKNVSVNLLTESAYFEVNKTYIEIDKVIADLKDNGFNAEVYTNDFSQRINKSELEMIFLALAYTSLSSGSSNHIISGLSQLPHFKHFRDS